MHSCLEGFCCCSVIIVSVLVVFLVVFIDVSTPRSRIYRRFVTSNRPPAGTHPSFKKTIEKECKTHHFPPPRRRTRGDSSLRPRGTVPELPSGTKGCKTSIWPTLFTRVKLRLAYRLAFVIKRQFHIVSRTIFFTHIIQIWVD